MTLCMTMQEALTAMSQTSFLSDVLGAGPVPVGKLVYFRGRLSNALHETVLRRLLEVEKDLGFSRAELGRRIGRKPEQVTRWLGSPGNWTLETVSDLLTAMGCELDPRLVALGRHADGQDQSTPDRSLPARALPMGHAITLSPGGVAFALRHAAAGALALELALLREGLSRSVHVTGPTGPSLLVMIDPDADSSPGAPAYRDRGDRLRFVLGKNRSSCLHTTLLRAWRDTMEARDVRVAGLLEGAPFDLCIRFEESHRPLAARRAR
jgi:hypothetical protein